MSSSASEPREEANPATPNDPSAPEGAQRIPFPELAGFRLIQELARSPKGVVYKARRLVEQDVVAVKIFRDEAGRESGFRERLQQSAEASFLLEHPALVRCLGCIEDDGRLLLVQEYVAGEPLSRALQRNVRFRPARALQVAEQLASALAYADQKHRHHGRLHPGDVLVRDGEARVLGIGLGELPEHAPWNVKDPHLFQPLIYCATECLPPRGYPADEAGRRAADLFALGGLLYHMLTGTPPFRGSDAESIVQERATIAPAAVRWPRGTERSLPVRAVHLVQRLLAADPAERGDFDMTLATLEAAIHEAEGRPAPVHAAAAPPPLPPAELPPRLRAPASDAAAQSAPEAPAAGAYGAVPAPPQHPARYSPPRTREQATSAMLIGAVVLVFGIAIGLAIKTFFMTPEGGNRKAETPPAAATPVTPETPSAAPLVAPAQVSAEEAKTAKTLGLIEEMLRSGDAKHDTTTLRLVDDLVRRTDEASVTGVRARLLKARIEEEIARGGAAPAPAAVPVPAAPTDAEEQVFAEHLARAQAKAAEQRFGEAIALAKELPAALKMAPYPEKAAEAAQKFEQQAKAAFADILLASDQALQAGDFAKARGLFQGVQARFGVPELVAAAGQRLQRVQEHEEAARGAQTQKLAEEKRQQEARTFAKLISGGLAEKASKFRYTEALEELQKFADAAQDPETKQLSGRYLQLIKDEQWLFNTARQRLKDQIERDPKHASPLQAFSKDKKPMYDIIDFNYRGITIRALAGAGEGERIKPWEELDPRQPVVMIQLLMEKSSAQEQLAYGSLNFHRALLAEGMAKAAPPAAEGEGDAPRFQPQALLTIAQSLRDAVEQALDAAARNDAAAKDRCAELRDTMKKVAEAYKAP